MGAYICYLDLLGIKDLAKYSVTNYHRSMNSFRDYLISTASDFIHKETTQFDFLIHFFSDCAFIETNDLEALFNYIRNLRISLNNEENLFFTAAISTGKLEAFSYYGQKLDDPSLENINPYTKSLLAGTEKFLRGTIFQSNDVSQVYVLQNNFKGVGVFVDHTVLDLWKKDKYALLFQINNQSEKGKRLTHDEIEKNAKDEYENFRNKYIAESFYFPNVTTNKVFSYFDLKLTENELHENYFVNIIKRYYSSNVKNKKYGRFYLTHFANWISSSSFSETSTSDEPLPFIYTRLINNYDILVENLKSTAHCFEFLYFFLLNKTYQTFISPNDVITAVVETMSKSPNCKKYLTKIDEIPDCVLSPSNKERFISDYQDLLNSKTKKIREKETKTPVKKQ